MKDIPSSTTPATPATPSPAASELSSAAAVPSSPAAAPSSAAAARPNRRSRRVLLLLILVCIAPVIASYFAYYVLPPSDRTNYGTLIDPQRPVPALDSALVRAGAAYPEAIEAESRRVVKALPEDAKDPLRALRGRWILLTIGAQGCDSACAERLFFTRQTQVSMGRERGRIARVLLLTDAQDPATALLDAHPDLFVIRVDPARLAAVFDAPDGRADQHLFLIDPLHNLMMRFPANPEPVGVRRDLSRLLRASRIG